jgi:hypothetical protein
MREVVNFVNFFSYFATMVIALNAPLLAVSPVDGHLRRRGLLGRDRLGAAPTWGVGAAAILNRAAVFAVHRALRPPRDSARKPSRLRGRVYTTP